MYLKYTFGADNAANATTPSVLNIRDPIIVPNPISDSAMKTLIMFVKSSGMLVAVAINVAAATSFEICRSSQIHSTAGRK